VANAAYFIVKDNNGLCSISRTSLDEITRLLTVMNANKRRRCSFPTLLSYPLLLGQWTLREDVAWRVLAGRIGLRHLFTP
jgi:hypothetical protein